MHTRYAHLNHVYVKVGDRVVLGQKIGTNGTANGQWYAHTHRDHPKRFPTLANGQKNWNFYCIGWSKQKVQEWFADPRKYPKALGKGFDHLGLGWLQYWDYASNSNRIPFARAKAPCFHPGLDENGKGAGNADYDAPVYCVKSGTVVHTYTGRGSNGKWGRMIVVQEDSENVNHNTKNMTQPLTDTLRTTLKHILGVDFGHKLSEGEQKNIARMLTEKIDALNGKIAVVTRKRDKMAEQADALERALKNVQEKDETQSLRVALSECQRTKASLSDEIASLRAKLKHVQQSQKEQGITPQQAVALITAKDWKRAGWTLVNFAMAAAVTYLSYLATNQNVAIAATVLPVAQAIAQYVTKKVNK